MAKWVNDWDISDGAQAAMDLAILKGAGLKASLSAGPQMDNGYAEITIEGDRDKIIEVLLNEFGCDEFDVEDYFVED